MKIMPWIRRELFEPLLVMKSSSPRLWYWKKLEETQYLSEIELKNIQWRRLQELLQYVWEHNDYYRKRLEAVGLGPNDLNTQEDFRRLPVLTKEDVRRDSLSIISQRIDVDLLQHAKTGGSTGKALDLYFSEECSELRNACARRHDCWTGWNLGEPIAACWGNPHLPKSYREKLKQWLVQPIIYLDTMNVSDSSVREFLNGWRHVQPTLLFGHAHSLFVLAQYLRKFDIDDLRPRGIISTSMMLISSEREVIEDVFGVKVIDRYGCEEVGLIACECERHEGMHLNIEHLFIEFLRDDGTPASNGEHGKIIVTDLMNRAMPLIRYQVEDMGVPTDRKCSCGRGLPLMENVAGRVADFLLRSDGSKVAGISLIENTLTQFPGLDQMQIVQQDYHQIEIRLVKGESYNSSVAQELERYFKSVFGEESTIEIVPVERILPEKSGKYRFSICKIL